jgi:large subunit ribosomal protein L29
MAMEIEKIRNLTDEELVTEEHKAAEQMFRLRFQISGGQMDGVKKLRELRKDVARFKTIARARTIDAGTGHGATTPVAPVKAAAVNTSATKSQPKPTVKAAAPKAEAKSAAKPAKKATATAAKSGKAAK